MFRKLKIFGALILCAGYVSSASADILVEPYLGYYTGKYEVGSTSEDFSGLGFGARVGYKHMLGLMLGLDYMTGKMEDKAAVKSDITPNQLGFFVGYEFPILLRVYGVYNFMDKTEGKNSTGTTKYEGDSGVKLGVGFTPLPLLSVNLEYGFSSYDEANGHSLSPTFDTKYYGLSVSLPLTF